MANITNASSIPAAQQDDIKKLLVQHGPSLDIYPVDVDGNPKETLTNAEAVEVFEHLTRRYWRMMLRDLAVTEARSDVRQAEMDAQNAALAAHEADPWA